MKRNHVFAGCFSINENVFRENNIFFEFKIEALRKTNKELMNYPCTDVSNLESDLSFSSLMCTLKSVTSPWLYLLKFFFCFYNLLINFQFLLNFSNYRHVMNRKLKKSQIIASKTTF